MNHVSSPPVDDRPWYRYPLLWLAILLPASSVVAGLTTLYIAVINADAPVVDEWYKEGRGINRSMEQEQIAARLGIGLVLSQVGAGVQARLTSDAGIPAPAMIKVALRHPTLKEKDVLLTLHHQGSGVFRADGVLPASGRFIATASTPEGHWRLYQSGSIEDGTVRLGHVTTP